MLGTVILRLHYRQLSKQWNVNACVRKDNGQITSRHTFHRQECSAVIDYYDMYKNLNHCHVNRRRISRPLSLGVQDIKQAGLVLRLRWQWFSRTDEGCAWAGLDLQFSEEHALIFASTSMTIGNGQTALFWQDRWVGGKSANEIAPKLYPCIPKRWRKLRTIADGLQAHAWVRDIHGNLGVHEIGQNLLLCRAIEHTILSDEPDKLIWK